MDLNESESGKGGEMEILHFSHQHPLMFIQDHCLASGTAYCFGCDQSLQGPRYGCNECKYFLHKRCAELELALRWPNNPFHPQHSLTLVAKLPYKGRCDFCHRGCRGVVYSCVVCKFDLHVKCALLQSSAEFHTFLHHHPLLFFPNHNEEVKGNCSRCMKTLSGPIYHCSVCSFPRFFNLHKECAELSVEINHPYDRKHPLTLLTKPPTHPRECTCYLCKIHWTGFVYSCSICKIELALDDFFAPRTITVASHEHPWRLLLRQMSFICDFCGVVGDHTPYLCTTCDLVVHKKCISMPRNIMITRHHHTISHSYSLPENEVGDWMCRICYEHVDTRYGSYYCSASDCNYVAHVHCATNKAIWDDESCKETQHASLNLITEVVEQKSIGEQRVAIEIKHEYHDHNLRLTFSGDIKDDSQCDGCVRPISTPFYTCDECKFFLHKDCAELPREKRHPLHKHVLTLTLIPGNDYSICHGCSNLYNGFSYRCNEDCMSYYNWDIRCISLSDTLEHPSHEHSLFLAHNCPTECSGCRRKHYRDKVTYRCMKHCGFNLDLPCVSQPLTAWYKHDRHPLTLTYSDDSTPSQDYCDLCENERDPNGWFYHCVDCDNSLHSRCFFGYLHFMKLGSKFEIRNHPHPLTVVKNIWNCPPCKVCRDLCNGVALDCKEPECNFTVHFGCRCLLAT